MDPYRCSVAVAERVDVPGRPEAVGISLAMGLVGLDKFPDAPYRIPDRRQKNFFKKKMNFLNLLGVVPSKEQ